MGKEKNEKIETQEKQSRKLSLSFLKQVTASSKWLRRLL